MQKRIGSTEVIEEPLRPGRARAYARRENALDPVGVINQGLLMVAVPVFSQEMIHKYVGHYRAITAKVLTHQRR